MINYPDPFLHPQAYWELTIKDITLNDWQKLQVLKAVGMSIDNPPKASKHEQNQ